MRAYTKPYAARVAGQKTFGYAQASEHKTSTEHTRGKGRQRNSWHDETLHPPPSILNPEP